MERKVSFKQKVWLRPYLSKNIKKATKDKFLNEFWKLPLYRLHGKTIGKEFLSNLLNLMILKLSTNQEKKSTFKG